VNAPARRSLSCATPDHSEFDNAHIAAHDGYYPYPNAFQYPGYNFGQMDVWSPDARLAATATPTTVQTMDVCSSGDFTATVTETDNGCNATDPNCPRVITYPDNDHRLVEYNPLAPCTFYNGPAQAWSAYSNISSTFSWSSQPTVGDWDESYDLWMGSFGGCNQPGIPQIELMVYTKWHGDVFAPTAHANFTTTDGNNYDVWWAYTQPDSNCPEGCLYIQTRLTTQGDSGTIHLRQIMQKMYANGYSYTDGTGGQPVMPYGANLADEQNGVEVVSGNNTVAAGPITFHFDAPTWTLS
jgi:hypothetical protein